VDNVRTKSVARKGPSRVVDHAVLQTLAHSHHDESEGARLAEAQERRIDERGDCVDEHDAPRKQRAVETIDHRGHEPRGHQRDHSVEKPKPQQ
jgi:hypothetical protein